VEKLTIVIPVYNEKCTIQAVVDKVLSVRVPLKKELIIVDDGSTDGTRDVLEGLKWKPITDPSDMVRVIFHGQNQGKGAALQTGFSAATGDVVVVQDADLEYDPDDYPVLLGPILAGKADVVYGSRFMGDRPHRVLFFWHMVGNKFLTLVSNMFTNLNLTDMETGYKMFRMEVLRSISLEQKRFGIEPELTAKVAKKGWRIYEVGTSYSGRSYAEGKKIGWRDGFKALYCIIKYWAMPA